MATMWVFVYRDGDAVEEPVPEGGPRYSSGRTYRWRGHVDLHGHGRRSAARKER